jgi:hypothetical protein
MTKKEFHEECFRANKKISIYCFDPALEVSKVSFVLTGAREKGFLPPLRLGAIHSSFVKNLFTKRDTQNRCQVSVSLPGMALIKSTYLRPNRLRATIKTNFHSLKHLLWNHHHNTRLCGLRNREDVRNTKYHK